MDLSMDRPEARQQAPSDLTVHRPHSASDTGDTDASGPPRRVPLKTLSTAGIGGDAALAFGRLIGSATKSAAKSVAKSAKQASPCVEPSLPVLPAA